MDYKEKLKSFSKEKDYFVGIDSDGCVFPSMELKQKECFIPNIVKYFQLQSISKYVRETAEWVNLYSIYRGANRFKALCKTFELLSNRKEIKKINFKLPDWTDLDKFVKSGLPLSNAGLKEFLKSNNSNFLKIVLEWSEAVNLTVEDMVKELEPFIYVRESLEKLKNFADIIIVSATPVDTLQREWRNQNLDKYPKLIAGQEMGSKVEHLKIAIGKYDTEKILMIGDAIGDYESAKKVDALFYPIKPGHEEESWERFYNEAIDKFFNLEYKGEYEKKLIDEFFNLLQEKPYWEK